MPNDSLVAALESLEETMQHLRTTEAAFPRDRPCWEATTLQTVMMQLMQQRERLQPLRSALLYRRALATVCSECGGVGLDLIRTTSLATAAFCPACGGTGEKPTDDTAVADPQP